MKVMQAKNNLLKILNKPIGIFDSGVGGLTVLREIEKLLPYEDIIYFGDTARVPYGNKSKSTIIKFSHESAYFLQMKKVKTIIVACNTSSALALNSLKKNFNVPILGVIEAGVNSALEVSETKRIGIIGTSSTIKSESYQKLVLKKNKKFKIYSQACPLFVPLVEEGLLKGKLVINAVKMYLKSLKERRVDTLILGCTHYPLLQREISSYLQGVKIIDSAKEVARLAFSVLKNKNLLKTQKHKGKVKFYVSDEPASFEKLAKLFLKRKISKPKVVASIKN